MKASNPVYSSRIIQWSKTEMRARNAFRLSKSDPTKSMILLMLVLILFFTLFLNVWIHIGFVHMGYKMAQLRHQEKNLRIENRNLIIQHAALLSDNRLQMMAVERFHLIPLTPMQVITIDEKDKY